MPTLLFGIFDPHDQREIEINLTQEYDRPGRSKRSRTRSPTATAIVRAATTASAPRPESVRPSSGICHRKSSYELFAAARDVQIQGRRHESRFLRSTPARRAALRIER